MSLDLLAGYIATGAPMVFVQPNDLLRSTDLFSSFFRPFVVSPALFPFGGVPSKAVVSDWFIIRRLSSAPGLGFSSPWAESADCRECLILISGWAADTNRQLS